ncbi:MAG: Rha family transcriptional regulator [Chromatiales bacterium]|nr:Rha family transcriptional regulator [Chromatiales bacterium]
MSNVIHLITTKLSMTSREIADMTGKRHDNVLRDIRAMIERFEAHNSNVKRAREADPNMDWPANSDLSWHCESDTYIDEQGKPRDQYVLDKDTTLTLVAGYDPVGRMRIIKRWQELEAGHAIPKVADPTLAALVQTVVELDQVKQQHAALVRKTEILETRVQNVELQHRNGVPEGYLSKKEAHHLYGVGLSEEIFECLLVKVGVTSKRYMHIAEGYKTPSTAYLEAEIQPAVEAFLEDAVQCSAVFCMSPMLDGKRFRYVKEAFSKEDAA